ncbi:MAG: DUF2478 domain-containing protein [Bradyrhizobium sp.]|jgi:hypothetical protein|uniref:DUF2478 domain-containing protein n=1 Tax=Bradyrhizobium sp. TaxID=376 RepID=UPI003C7CA7F6
MFHAQCDLAALVYGDHDNPDAVLRDFADALNAQGCRVVGMVQTGQCADSSLSAVLVHNGETLLLAQPPSPGATGCKLDVSRLQNAGTRVAEALAAGADLLIINRFGKRERDGKGLGFLIERARAADVPVIIAVSYDRFTDWTSFSGGVSAKLVCDRDALTAWWRSVSRHAPLPGADEHVTVCEAVK